MRKLIIHVGHAKTGTTSLQHSFARERQELLKLGVLYPKTYGSSQHSAIKPALTGDLLASAGLMRRLKNDRNAIERFADTSWQDLRDEVAKTQPDTIVLSSETFFNVGRNGKLKPFIDGMKTIADDIHVVAYVRSPAERYLSSRQQNVKFLGVRKPPKVEDWYRSALEPFLDHPDVTTHIHHFKRDKLVGNDIVADFVTRHLNDDVLACVKKDLTLENTSMSAEAMAILEARHLDHDGSMEDAFPRSLSRKIMELDQELEGFSRPKYKAGIAAVVHNTASDLDWLSAKTGIVFDVPEGDPDAAGLTPKDLVAIRDVIHVNEDRLAQLQTALNESPAAQRGLKFLVARLPKRVLRGLNRWGKTALAGMKRQSPSK